MVPNAASQKRFVVLLVIACLVLYCMMIRQDSINGTAYEEGCVKCNRMYKEVIVHLDLKGAPPTLSFIENFFELLELLSVDGVLIEYEDMFPYNGTLKSISRNGHYTDADINKINEIAEKHKLEVIPLIQSFGHLEFVLKHSEFAQLKENPLFTNTICPSDEKSIELIKEMIVQVRRAHPKSKRIHIGADEAYHIAEDERCNIWMRNANANKSHLKLNHITRIGKFAKEAGFEEVFAWNDMFDKESVEMMTEAKLAEAVTPVVWGYARDVTTEGYFPNGLFERLPKTFDKFWFATAYKGANGINQTFMDISRYLDTHVSYKFLADMHHSNVNGKVAGVIVTGWSRYSHTAPLCELLAVSIPSLVADLTYINFPLDTTTELWRKTKMVLKCTKSNSYEFDDNALVGCDFPGSEVYKLIMRDWKMAFNAALLRGMSRAGYPVKTETHQEIDPENKLLEKIRQSLSSVILNDADEYVSQISKLLPRF